MANKRAELSPLDSALEAYRAGRFDDAVRAFDALAAGDPNADLWAARSRRESKGCRSAVARFDKVARRASGTAPGWDALLEGALCYRALGDFGKARVYFTALLAVDSHKDRARAELDRIGELQRP
jgi:tetratricopeptide (TPR) repeat protein